MEAGSTGRIEGTVGEEISRLETCVWPGKGRAMNNGRKAIIN